MGHLTWGPGRGNTVGFIILTQSIAFTDVLKIYSHSTISLNKNIETGATEGGSAPKGLSPRSTPTRDFRCIFAVGPEVKKCCLSKTPFPPNPEMRFNFGRDITLQTLLLQQRVPLTPEAKQTDYRASRHFPARQTSEPDPEPCNPFVKDHRPSTHWFLEPQAAGWKRAWSEQCRASWCRRAPTTSTFYGAAQQPC